MDSHATNAQNECLEDLKERCPLEKTLARAKLYGRISSSSTKKCRRSDGLELAAWFIEMFPNGVSTGVNERQMHLFRGPARKGR